MFRAAAMAGKTPLAAFTFGSNLRFCHAKFALLFAVDHFFQIVAPYITQPVLGVDVVIAAINIAVLLNDQAKTAG